MEEYKDTAEVFKKSFEKAGKKFEKERKKAVRKRQRGPMGKEWGRKVEAPKTAEDWKEFKEASRTEAGRGVAENALEMVWEETGLRESTESKAEVMTVKCSAAVKDFEHTNAKAGTRALGRLINLILHVKNWSKTQVLGEVFQNSKSNFLLGFIY